jgi:hypothetical protein
MNDCEQRAQEMEQQLGRAGIYFRFSVEQGMQTEYPGQAADPSWILAQTESYLADHETSEKISAFVQNINSSGTIATLDQLSKSPLFFVTVVKPTKLKHRHSEYVGGSGVSLQSNATLEGVLNVTSKLSIPRSHGVTTRN